MHSDALARLRQMLGPDAQFRDGQWEAIETLVQDRGRALIVQRTGWGKSIVYFLAAKLLRNQQHGPTILISGERFRIGRLLCPPRHSCARTSALPYDITYTFYHTPRAFGHAEDSWNVNSRKEQP